MFTQKGHILTVAAVITTLTMAGGVGAVALEAHRSASPTAHPAQVVVAAAAPTTQSYVDDVGGGDH